MATLIRTRQAEADLEEILENLSEYSPKAAKKFAKQVEDQCRLLAQFPGMGRASEELAAGLRSVAIDQHVLFFRVSAEEVQIIRILHGRRDFTGLLE